MRFAFGAGFVARRLTEVMAKSSGAQSVIGCGSQRRDHSKVSRLESMRKG